MKLLLVFSGAGIGVVCYNIITQFVAAKTRLNSDDTFCK